MENKYLSLWSINDGLDLNRMKDQLDQMKMCGLVGVIFHPRYSFLGGGIRSFGRKFLSDNQ